MERGHVILVDTNIVIEAVRTHCWNAIANWYALETVETCQREALRDSLRPGYVTVGIELLQKGLKAVHTVNNIAKARLSLSSTNASALDAGEHDLFAHALGRSDAWLVACADRAAVNIAFSLGWEERVVSLEKLVQQTGSRPNPALNGHFTEKWLSSIRTAYRMDKGLR